MADEIEIQIDHEKFDEAYELLKSELYKNKDLVDKQQLQEMALLTKDRHGKVKFKRPGEKKEMLRIGDRVTNQNGQVGTIIDIDEESDMVCVKINELEVWKMSEIEKKM